MTLDCYIEKPAVLIIDGEKLNVMIKKVSEKQEEDYYNRRSYYDKENDKMCIGKCYTDKTFVIECMSNKANRIFV